MLSGIFVQFIKDEQWFYISVLGMSHWQDFVSNEISNVDDSVAYESKLIEIYKKHTCRNCTEKEVYRLAEGRIYTLNEELNHLCTPYCVSHPTWAGKRNLVTRITNIFISNHGNVHVCSEKCDGEKEFSDGFQTCKISGIRYQMMNYCNAFKKLHEYHRTSSTTVRVETTALQECAKECIYRLLFSNDRQRIEKKKIYDLKKDIQKLWIKTKRQHDKKKEMVNFIGMLTLASNVVKKKISKTYIVPEESVQKMIVDFYTERVCEFFLKLKTLTNFTTYNTQQNVGDAFVAAVLFMMRSGLRIDDFDVIAKDFFLNVILPEANSLDHFKVNKCHFTSYRNYISMAIRDSIHVSLVRPSKLMLCSLQV